MRTVASIVLVTYLTLVISPGVQALERAGHPDRALQQVSAEQRTLVGEAIARAQEPLRALAGREASDRKPTRREKDAAKEALRAWRDQTQSLIETARAEFESTGELLRHTNVPEVILQRHARALSAFDREVSALNLDVGAVLRTADDSVERARAEAALLRLERGGLGRSRQEFDPNNLPNSALRPDRSRTPRLTEADFQAALLLSDPRLLLARSGEFDFSRLPGAENPTYLESTTEVTLTLDIEAKATELRHSPVEIYNWVRNNVHWLPTWGAIQNASHTLSSQRGNAFDIAGLMIALLRASGIPARYVHGTIEMPEDRFRNWAGGFENIDAAVDFASSGGIPIAAVTSGGRITKIRMEHIWVEAAIDFHPSRGAVNRSADSWAPMDPSFKQIEVLPGLDTLQIAGVDTGKLAEDFLASGTTNETEGWTTGFDPAILQDAQRQARQSIEDYLRQNLPDATVGDVLGGRRIVQSIVPVLAASLPNRIIAAGARYASIPTALQQQITFAFGKDALGEPVNPTTFPWAQLNNKQVTLSFRPASPADEDTLRAFLPEGEITDISQLPTSIPAYLIHVVPELKVEGELVMSGGAMTLGSELNFVFNPRFVSAGTKSFSYKLPAGSYLAVAVIGGSVSPAALEATQLRIRNTRTKIESNDPSVTRTMTNERLFGDMFAASMLGYYGHYISLGALTGLRQSGHHHLAAGLGTLGHEPEVDALFGIARRIYGGGATLNIPMVNTVGSDAGSGVQRRNFTLQLGILSSALEHAVPAQMFALTADQNSSVSAVKALISASAAGQRVYQITPENLSNVIDQIHHDQATMDEIQAAIAAGRMVITHTDAMSIPGWSGAGYVIIDSDTGAAAWKISGSQNGGFITGLVLGTLLFLEISLLVLSFPIAAAGAPILGALAGAEAIALLAVTLTNMLSQYFAGQGQEYQECLLLGLAASAFIAAVGALIFPPFYAALGAVVTILGLGIDLSTMIAGDGTLKQCLRL